jgi:HD-GYP domain-containing protein (c-di-GMP phosphodiesterase class II)
LSASTATHTRIPILYLILGVLLVVGIVPIYCYSSYLEGYSRDLLTTNERLLQNTVTRSLADDLTQHESSMRMMHANLASAIEIATGGDVREETIATPEIRALLENFLSSSNKEIIYTTVLDSEGRGIRAGDLVPDIFLQRELERAFAAAHDGRVYHGQALVEEAGKSSTTVVLVSSPVMYNQRFLGMVASVVDLHFLIQRLRSNSSGLAPFVVDSQGRLVAAAASDYATGQDMKNFEIVRSFVEDGNKDNVVATHEFKNDKGSQREEMLGTFRPVTSLNWAVVVQKPLREAYSSVSDMQRKSGLVVLIAVLLIIGVSTFAARRITNPLAVLTQRSRAMAKGDFSQRVNLWSRTEIGELAHTFNTMSDELERFVADLKSAADENRALFMGSIQMLAGAVDEKDPYTRGHSDRVTRYSMLIAKEMQLPDSFMETLQISAQLHDVGKIGIEDHILKKPGALTAEEFEVMKTHTTKGANILRPVTQLAEMLPGIELHHEALDGRGYPYGLEGDQIPLLARVIAVGDTFDALTTNRPYQQAHTPEQALQIIQNLSGKRLDPDAVKALLAVCARGEIKIQRFTIKRPVMKPSATLPATAPAPVATTPAPTATAAAAAAAASVPAPTASTIAAETSALERTRV